MKSLPIFTLCFTLMLQPAILLAQESAVHAPAAKDAVHLGDTRAKCNELCGTPVLRSPSDDLFVTDRYIIEAMFEQNLVGEITYCRSANPDKAVQAMKERRSDYLMFLEPLSDAEIQAILARHSENGSLSWAALPDKAWKRSDGVMAGYYTEKKTLLIATAKGWQSFSGPRK